MQSKLNIYLQFKNNAREAMEFYHSVFGGKLDMDTFEKYGMSTEPGEKDKIMHAMLEAENGITFMAADTPGHEEYKPSNTMSMALSGDNDKELRNYWDKLSGGGKVLYPLEKSPWNDIFGMFIDKFGITWMVNITLPK